MWPGRFIEFIELIELIDSGQNIQFIELYMIQYNLIKLSNGG